MVYQIDFHGTKGIFEMSEGYSSYPDQGEVLIQDGLQYSITDIEEKEDDGKPFFHITLRYPPQSK